MAKTILALCALLVALPAAAAAKTPPLTGYGATRAVFLAHHPPGPRLRVVFVEGDALHVSLAFAPTKSEAAALAAVAKLLPADAKRLRVVHRSACLQLVYGSLAFASRFESAIWVELKGPTARYRPSAVAAATFDTAAADRTIPC